LWLDQRMAKGEDPVPLTDSLMFQAVGMKETIEIIRRRSKANWIRENEKEIWDKTYKVLLLSGYLTYKLTGRFVDSTANQIGHIPFNYKRKSWPLSFKTYRYGMFGIDRNKLPDLIGSGEIIGNLTDKASEETGIGREIPLIACGSDKGCETLGTGCIDESSVSLSFGTTATAQTTSKKCLEPLRFFPSYPSVIKDLFNPEIQIVRGYWMISWFKKEFAQREMKIASMRNISPEEILNETLASVPPGCQGLILQPYWGAAHKMPEAKGSIIGFGDIHTRAHIYRAIIEGIGFALLEGVESIEKKTKVKVDKVMVSGGGSQSDYICQITADMFGRTVYKERTYETSGLGAAINGFVALGYYKSYEDAVTNMVHYVKKFIPDEHNHKIYSALYKRVYKNIYKNLSGLYKEIQAITGYPIIY
jgi:sugar (pentulose or hexulose) kinase